MLIFNKFNKSKVPNEGRLGATGNTPVTSKKISEFSELQKIRVMEGLLKEKLKFQQIEVGQLYKDVDQDHQQKYINSNIYIPDIDDEKTSINTEAYKSGANTNIKTHNHDIR